MINFDGIFPVDWEKDKDIDSLLKTEINGQIETSTKNMESIEELIGELAQEFVAGKIYDDYKQGIPSKHILTAYCCILTQNGILQPCTDENIDTLCQVSEKHGFTHEKVKKLINSLGWEKSCLTILFMGIDDEEGDLTVYLKKRFQKWSSQT